MDWKKIGLFVCGVFTGCYGLRILTGREAKKAYIHTTAAVLRMKDAVIKDVTTIRENAGDILAAAKDINEERQRECDAQIIEDAEIASAEASDMKEEA